MMNELSDDEKGSHAIALNLARSGSTTHLPAIVSNPWSKNTGDATALGPTTAETEFVESCISRGIVLFISVTPVMNT